MSCSCCFFEFLSGNDSMTMTVSGGDSDRKIHENTMIGKLHPGYTAGREHPPTKVAGSIEKREPQLMGR